MKNRYISMSEKMLLFDVKRERQTDDMIQNTLL